MNIKLENISKKFGTQWVFKDLNYLFEEGKKYALIGPNGSGKSTLLKIIIAKIPFTKGKIIYTNSTNKNVNAEDFFKYTSIATTSMSLIEEFSLEELLKFHFKFRKSIHQYSTSEILKILDLEKEKTKFISNFSSGMKQRLKIGLAILTESNVLILDEPGANLDDVAKLWYKTLLSDYLGGRMLIIASNEKSDYEMCDNIVEIL